MKYSSPWARNQVKSENRAWNVVPASPSPPQALRGTPASESHAGGVPELDAEQREAAVSWASGHSTRTSPHSGLILGTQPGMVHAWLHSQRHTPLGSSEGPRPSSPANCYWVPPGPCGSSSLGVPSPNVGCLPGLVQALEEHSTRSVSATAAAMTVLLQDPGPAEPLRPETLPC